MRLSDYTILLGYRKDKVSETRVVLNHMKEIERQIQYMADIDEKLTTVEELKIQENGMTVYWQTHRMSDYRSNKVETTVESFRELPKNKD